MDGKEGIILTMVAAEGREGRHPGPISVEDDSASSATSSSNDNGNDDDGKIQPPSVSVPSSPPSLLLPSYSRTSFGSKSSLEFNDSMRRRPSMPSSPPSLLLPSYSRTSFDSKSSLDYNDSMLLQSPNYESPAAFENFDFELPLRWYRRIWSFFLGTAGILDILAYIEPDLRLKHDKQCAVLAPLEFGESVSDLLLLELEDDFYPKSAPWYCSTWVTFLDRLRDYNLVIAFSFSLLWFMYSHGKAREEYYHKFTVREDRQQLNFEKRKRRKFNAQNAYYRRILSRTLLLPVGFFVILFHLMRGLMNGEWLYRELLIDKKVTNETAFLTIQDPSEILTIEINEAEAKMSTAFAIFLYVKYHFLLATTLARTEFLKEAIPRLRRKLVVDAARNPRKLIRRVKKLLRYVRWIKYIIPLIIKLNKLRANTAATLRKRRQYRLAKRRSKLLMELKKERSRSEVEHDAAVLIQRTWKNHQKHMYRRVAIFLMKDMRSSAAMRIQHTYRRTSLQGRIEHSRKRRELLHLERRKRQESQMMNDEDRKRLYELQDEFMTEAKKTINKRLLVRPNTRLAVLWNSIFIFCVLVEILRNSLRPWLILPKAKQAEAEKYQSMRLFLAESLTPLPVAETSLCKDALKKPSALHRLFFHKHHLEQPTREEVVSAFIEEITDPDYGLEGLGDFSYYNSSATNANHPGNNGPAPKPKIPWRCSEPISTWRDRYRDMVALTFRPDPVSEWQVCQPREFSLFGKMLAPLRLTKKKKKKKKRNSEPPLPWYCTRPYSTFHDWYRSSWNFVIDQLQIVIAVICFVDVFVKFFTGDIDPITGELGPKPFFKRWIFPGLLLQLLVNPAIGSFSVWLFATVDGIMVIGPVRVLRWCIAVVVPMGYALRNLVISALQEAESDRQLAQYGIMLWDWG